MMKRLILSFGAVASAPDRFTGVHCMRTITAALLALSVSNAASSASAGTIVTFAATEADVVIPPNANHPISLNLAGYTAAATLPGYWSTTTSVFSTTDLSVAFDQHRGGDLNDASFGFGRADFTASGFVSYAISGSYTNSAGYTGLEAWLYDYTAAAMLFDNAQASSGGAATFNLGQTGGNFRNTLIGSLTGTLVAGHTYTWLATTDTEAPWTADSGATASGSATLKFIDTSPDSSAVPEPSATIVWSLLGIVTAGGAWWRRRNVPA
jgi:hypothetical protein